MAIVLSNAVKYLFKRTSLKTGSIYGKYNDQAQRQAEGVVLCTMALATYTKTPLWPVRCSDLLDEAAMRQKSTATVTVYNFLTQYRVNN